MVGIADVAGLKRKTVLAQLRKEFVRQKGFPNIGQGLRIATPERPLGTRLYLPELPSTKADTDHSRLQRRQETMALIPRLVDWSQSFSNVLTPASIIVDSCSESQIRRLTEMVLIGRGYDANSYLGRLRVVPAPTTITHRFFFLGLASICVESFQALGRIDELIDEGSQIPLPRRATLHLTDILRQRQEQLERSKSSKPKSKSKSKAKSASSKDFHSEPQDVERVSKSKGDRGGFKIAERSALGLLEIEVRLFSH